MTPGLHGTLLSRHFAGHRLAETFAGRLGEAESGAARRRLRRWWRESGAALGPAASVRALFDRGAAPLAAILGYAADGLSVAGPLGPGVARLRSDEGAATGLIVAPWGADLDGSWRDAVREGIRRDSRWCYAFNGVRLRLVDAERTYARRHVEIDLETAADDPAAFAVLWGLFHARALAAGDAAPALLDQAVAASDAHGAGVRASLGAGVHAALLRLLSMPAGGRRAADPGRLFEPALVVIYRILFLLFAEARGLVPVWHPMYRDSYSLDRLSRTAERGSGARGLWEALEAVTRLAGRGCRAGDLRVTPFNGRLFSPAATAPLDRRRPRALDPRDAPLADVLVALTTAPGGRAGRERIAYADLGVEQLGAVYERVLDYTPVAAPGPRGARRAAAVTLRPAGRRKATGSFYTPRALTDFLVRRTLHPLVDGAAPEAILSLRVLDAAMGSGAFLVSACRYLAAAYESALVRSGARAAGDVTDADRAGFRRTIAQRCLYGVDRNPMAVQLGRLSIWLATLAADRPLTFLDHNLRAGDSLAGASMADIARQPPPGGGAAARGALPLFDTAPLAAAIESTVSPRARIAIEPGDDLDAVRAKERLHSALVADDAPLARWRAVADLWCAAAFWPEPSRAPRAGEFWALADRLLRGQSPLAPRVAAPRLVTARRVAAERAFFHWTLEFPEIFSDARGRARPDPGFDAVVGNPPWEMLRADQGAPDERRAARESAARLARFARASGAYRLQGDGHTNLYQLFLERALGLARRGGRIGLVLPSGLTTDRGSAALRQALVTGCRTDTLISFENREAVFPIHRSYRFLLLTTTVGGETDRLRCRFGERSAAALDLLPDAGGGAREFPIVLSSAALRRLGGPRLTIPELRSPLDLAITEKAAAGAPPLGHPDGWGARFGRELNATEDRRHFGPPGAGLPVVEGKLIRPFGVDAARSRHAVAEAVAARLLDREATFGRPRLAFRDVASATNQRSLIAAILPAGVVSTHTLLCLKTPIDEGDARVLCALLNSLVVNYLVRQRMGTHVTATIAGELPVPRPPRGSRAHAELAACAAGLARGDDGDLAARLEARVAELYALTDGELAHVLGTFPLVEPEVRRRALDRFRAEARARAAVL